MTVMRGPDDKHPETRVGKGGDSEGFGEYKL